LGRRSARTAIGAGSLIPATLRSLNQTRTLSVYHAEVSKTHERLNRENLGEQAMVSHYRTSAEIRRERYEQRGQLQRETVLPLGAALIVIALSSLGLWWAILSVVWPPLASTLLE
jgi:hypothetical protein